MRRLLLLALLGLPLFAVPAIVQVESASCTSPNTGVSVIPSSGNCTFPGSVTSGNVIVALVGVRTNGSTGVASWTTGGTASLGGYSLLYKTSTGAAGVGAEIWCTTVTGSGTHTLVANMDTIYFGHLFLAEISGTNGCSTVGTAIGGSSMTAGGPYTPGSITTPGANALLLNVAYVNYATGGGSDMVLTAGYTQIGLNNLGNPGREAGAQAEVVAAGSYNPVITAGTAAWADAIVALAPSGASPSVYRRRSYGN